RCATRLVALRPASASPFMSLDIEASNTEALRRISSAEPFLVDVRRAGDVIPDLEKKELLHAGPPLQGWHEACGALRGAGTGTLVHLGLGGDLGAAEEAVRSGAIVLSSANDRN